jgi:electron transfer flavoprotein beta subunit
MKIIVSIKQVPARDSNLRIDAGAKWLDESDLTFEMNEPDAYALEEALQLRESAGGEVIVVCAGPERAASTIREALAKGADRAIHIVASEAKQWDALATAGLLSLAIKDESPDLVLTGLQSDDLGLGQTGVVLAELLGYAHATIIMQVEVSGTSLRVKRELEDGWFQHLTLPMPAVLAIQSGIKKLRYATLMGIKRAKNKEIKVINAADAGPELVATAAIDRIYAPSRSKTSQIFTGPPNEAAAQLVEKLKFEARVI